LNSSVQAFLKTGTDESFNTLNTVFEFCQKECDNPDLRERGYFYLRLLEIDANLAKELILTEKPPISQESSNIDSSLLEKLIDNFGTLAVIYSKPPELFVKKVKRINIGEEEEYDLEDNNLIGDEEEESSQNKKNENKNKNSNNYEENENNNSAIVSEFNSVNKLQDNSAIAHVNNGPSLIDLNDILGIGASVGPQGNQNNNNYNNIANYQQANQMSNLSLIDLDNFGSSSINNNKNINNNDNSVIDLLSILGNSTYPSGNNNTNNLPNQSFVESQNNIYGLPNNGNNTNNMYPYQLNNPNSNIIPNDIYNNNNSIINNNDLIFQQNIDTSNFTNPSRKLGIIPKMVNYLILL
jgi:hypothetical protein